MEMWTEVRRRVLTGELSKRAACQEYGINWRTLAKMLAHAEPPPLAPARGPPADWGELVQASDDRDVFQGAPDDLPVIDIHSL